VYLFPLKIRINFLYEARLSGETWLVFGQCWLRIGRILCPKQTGYRAKLMSLLGGILRVRCAVKECD